MVRFGRELEWKYRWRARWVNANIVQAHIFNDFSLLIKPKQPYVVLRYISFKINCIRWNLPARSLGNISLMRYEGSRKMQCRTSIYRHGQII